MTWPEEDGKIRKQQTKKTDETHLRSFRFFEAARCVETPSPSKSLKSRQVQLGVEMSISYNVNIIHLIVTQDSSKKTQENAFVRATPTAYRRRLWSPFKIFQDLSRIANVAKNFECFECFECCRQADPPGASSVTMTSADQMDSDRNEEKTCFDSKS